MGQLKHRLLFLGLSISAYASPLLMILSILTHYWLNSTEKITAQQGLREKISTTPAINLLNNNSKSNENQNFYYPQLDYIEASYGLWKMCRITDTSMQQRCEYIKYFQNSDSEPRITDTLKKQIGVCIVPIFIAMVIMITSVILHTYAYIHKRLHYLYLVSGCLFIFAGLASLTALIVFIAAVNGAVDNKLTLNKSKEEEPPFDYNYGFSFFCAVFSFLMQEFNGICNIYWYIDYYRKYRYGSENQRGSGQTKFPVLPQVIKLEDLSKDKKQEIKIINESEPSVKSDKPKKRPSTNRLHKLSHQNYKSSYKKDSRTESNVNKQLLPPPNNLPTESSLTESSHPCSSSSSILNESSTSSISEYETKLNTLSNRQLDENELKFKFYKLDKEILPPVERPKMTQKQRQNTFRTQKSVSKSPSSSKIRMTDFDEIRPHLNRAQRIRLNKPLLTKNKSLNDALMFKSSMYNFDNYYNYRDYARYMMLQSDDYYNSIMGNDRLVNLPRRMLIQNPYKSNQNQNAQTVRKKRILKRTTSV